MKICIITCQNAYNYGARLQAFALARYLRQQGQDVNVIDYRPDYMRGDVQVLFWPGLSVKKWGKMILQFPARYRAKHRKQYFDNFSRQYIPLTSKTYWDIDDLRANAPEADLYIAGSDQIWNTDFRNGTDPGYYLDFGSEHTRRISYAASFATEDVAATAREFVRNKLARFDAISVREHSALHILNSLGSYVVSNSFHGTAFAMIFGIPYAIVNREDGLNVRMRDLAELDIAHLDKRITLSQAYLKKFTTPTGR